LSSQLFQAHSTIWNGKKTNPCSDDLAPNRGLPSQFLTKLLVRSYRTLTQERRKKKEERREELFLILHSSLFILLSFFLGGIFLWHYPHDRSHWALPSKSGFWGARTFLRR
jgi:hypothetical protein